MKKFAIVAAIALSLAPLSASAGERCSQVGPVTYQCVAGIPAARMNDVAAFQEMPEWCWAASISMIFGYHGHAVSQQDIVTQAYGSVVNMPALSGSTITSELSRSWSDASGRRFRSSARVFDLQGGQFGLTNDDIVRELAAERPLVIGAQGHAMVLTAVQYFREPMGVRIVGATVRDPWPTNGGRRQLTMSELSPMYLAAVSVEALDDPAAETPETTAASGCKADCARAARTCLSDIESVEQCLDARIERCMRACTERYGFEEDECRYRLCDPNSGSNTDWEETCRAKHRRAERQCRDERSSCESACGD